MPLEDLELFILNDGYTDMLSFCETSLCRCHWGLNDLHSLSDVCRRSKKTYTYIYIYHIYLFVGFNPFEKYDI